MRNRRHAVASSAPQRKTPVAFSETDSLRQAESGSGQCLGYEAEQIDGNAPKNSNHSRAMRLRHVQESYTGSPFGFQWPELASDQLLRSIGARDIPRTNCPTTSPTQQVTATVDSGCRAERPSSRRSPHRAVDDLPGVGPVTAARFVAALALIRAYAIYHGFHVTCRAPARRAALYRDSSLVPSR